MNLYIVHEGKQYEINVESTGMTYPSFTAGPQVTNHAELVVRVDLGDWAYEPDDVGSVISAIFDRAHEILEASQGL